LVRPQLKLEAAYFCVFYAYPHLSSNIAPNLLCPVYYYGLTIGGENMLDKVSILLPFSKEPGPRTNNFNWTVKFYEKMMPEAEICIGEYPYSPWNRPKAINLAAAKATRDIFVISETDIFYDPAILVEAIKLLDKYTWVLPFSKVFDLDQQSTEEIHKIEPSWPIPIKVNGNIPGHIGHGLVNVIPRKHFEAVGGFDERFLGWGGDDDAFASSINGVVGWYMRMNHLAYHFWHPSGDLTHYGENLEYLKRYFSGVDSVKKEIEERKKNSGKS
jgi:hypothetical protein